MRIGIDCRLWNQTGVGRYIRNLVFELQKIDKKNTYVLFCRDEDREEIKNQISKIKDNEWKIVKANARWHSVAEQTLFFNILNKAHCDLVHFPYFSHPIFYNQPFVVTIHDLIINHFPTGQASTLPLPVYAAKLFMYNRVFSHAVKKSKKIIVPLYAVEDDLVQMTGVSKDKIVVTKEGVASQTKNDGLITKNMDSKFKVSDSKYFLYVGNAYPHKNLERLIAAFASIKYEGSKLVLVGKEDYFYKRLKQKVENLGLIDKIIFTGFVSDEELSYLYHHATAAVIPSLMEGFGLPALEAMQNNCVVVCSDTPALKEVCQNAAVYFDPYNIDGMANTLEVVYNLTENEKKAYQKKGKAIVDKFSWEKMAEQTLKIYQEI